MFIDYLTRLIGEYQGRKIILICNDHSTHHAKELKAWAVAHTEQIELCFLPAYSPHLNPDEYLNQDVKRHSRALHERPTTKPGLKDTLTSFLGLRQSQPEIVRQLLQRTRDPVRPLTLTLVRAMTLTYTRTISRPRWILAAHGDITWASFQLTLCWRATRRRAHQGSRAACSPPPHTAPLS